MTDLIAFMNLFAAFRAASWVAWRQEVLARITERIREAYVIAGRGSGKSRISALLGAFHGTRRYPRALGEAIVIAIIAPSRQQALITFRYLRGLLHSVPVLASLITRETSDTIELSTGCVIEVISASVWSPRGRSFGCVILEEAAFFDSDETSANPVAELVRAVRPGLARVPGSRLIAVSSPFAPTGLLWEMSQRFEGQETGDVLVVRQPTWVLNPLFDRAEIDRAFRDDPIAAATEFGAEFRADGAGLLFGRAALAASTVPDRRELAPRHGLIYAAFADPAGGSGSDSFTSAIAHAERRDGRWVAVLDAVRECRPPFSPEAAIGEIAAVCGRYGVSTVVADRYAADFAVEAFGRAGLTLWPSPRTASEIYGEFMPALNSGQVELLDDPRLLEQFAALQRRPSRGGREFIGHPIGQHDDLANAAAGAILDALWLGTGAAGIGDVVTSDRGSDVPFQVDDPRPNWIDVIHRGRTWQPSEPSGARASVGRVLHDGDPYFGSR